jgi:hypothetical protein
MAEMDDFLTTQVEALGALECIRLWTPADDAGTVFTMLVEAVREEDSDTFSLRIGSDVAESALPGLAPHGFSQRDAVLPSNDPEAVARTMRESARLVALDARRLSLTHVSREEVLARRRIAALLDRINDALASRGQGTWTRTEQVPVRFRADTVQIIVWPKPISSAAIVEVWAYVAGEVPVSADVDALIHSCNAGFSYGRLIRQESMVWYRDVFHAEPMSDAALHHSIQVAAATALQFGPKFADLGAVDGTAAPDVEDQPTPEAPVPGYL